MNGEEDLKIESDDEFEDDMEPNVMSDLDFESVFEPEEMRCLALVAHNHMKPAMRKFVLENKNLLRKFRLTGTNTTMTMLHEVFGDDPDVVYGPTCESGPLGGDAELCALMCMEELGGMVFLQDPMDAHPHKVDIDCLVRQANVHDVLIASNPSSAYALTAVLRLSMRNGNKAMIRSFFKTEYSTSVDEYILRKKDAKQYIDHVKNLFCEDSSTVDAPKEDNLADEEEAKLNALKAVKNGESMKEGLSVEILNIKVEKKTTRRKSIMRCSIADFQQLNDADYDVDSDDEDYGLFEKKEDTDFFSQLVAEEMRCLALIAHNHMKPELKEFIKYNKNTLRKFRLTGNNTTMEILKSVYGDDPLVRYGPICQSGPLGGDAQLCALMCMNELGGLVFFQDPMDSHPHQADIDCLNRQINVHDIYLASNSSSAYAMMSVLRMSLKKGNKARISSFFESKKSPSVAEYKKRQKAVLDQNIANAARAAAQAPVFVPAPKSESIDSDESIVTSKKKKKKGLFGRN